MLTNFPSWKYNPEITEVSHTVRLIFWGNPDICFEGVSETPTAKSNYFAIINKMIWYMDSFHATGTNKTFFALRHDTTLFLTLITEIT